MRFFVGECLLGFLMRGGVASVTVGSSTSPSSSESEAGTPACDIA